MKAKVTIKQPAKAKSAAKPSEEKPKVKVTEGVDTDLDEDEDEDNDESENAKEVAKIKDRVPSADNDDDDAEDDEDEDEEENAKKQPAPVARKASVKKADGEDLVEIAMTRTIRAPRIGNHEVREIIGTDKMVQGEAYMVPRDVAIVLRDKKAAIGGK